MPKRKKILIAAGGTGGHLFPAQALAEQLLEEDPLIELFFAGSGLSLNPYLNKERFRFCEVVSTTPFRGSFLKALKSVFLLMRGIKESYALLLKEKPTLIVGFGSFHTFPLLCAAVLRKVPIALFESNAIPGKVVRLFSKRAQLTGIYFSEARRYLKGNTVEVEIPTQSSLTPSALSKQQAREELGLDPHLPTLLVFGGSQGAQGINRNIIGILPLLKKASHPFQLIHLTGCEETALSVRKLCEELEIRCYIKKFEKGMQKVWSAADKVICRAGAMTLSELLHYEVPGILIPYPAASDGHQLKNALFIEQKVGGAVHLPQSSLTPELLVQTIIDFQGAKSAQMKAAIQQFKSEQKRASFCKLILKGES